MNDFYMYTISDVNSVLGQLGLPKRSAKESPDTRLEETELVDIIRISELNPAQKNILVSYAMQLVGNLGETKTTGVPTEFFMLPHNCPLTGQKAILYQIGALYQVRAGVHKTYELPSPALAKAAWTYQCEFMKLLIAL